MGHATKGKHVKKEIHSFNEVPSHSSLIALDEMDLEQVQAGQSLSPSDDGCPSLRPCGTLRDDVVIIS